MSLREVLRKWRRRTEQLSLFCGHVDMYCFATPALLSPNLGSRMPSAIKLRMRLDR